MLQVHQIQQYTGHKGSIFALAVDQTNGHFYSSGDDGLVARWELEAGVDRGEALLSMPHAIYGLEVIPEKGLIVAGASEGSLSFVNIKTNKLIKQYARSRDAIYQIRFMSDTNRIWILQANGGLSVLDADNLEERAFKRVCSENLRDVVSQNGLAYLAASDGAIYVLDEKGLGEIHRVEAHDNSVFSLCLHPSKKYLFSGGRDAQLCVWDIDNQMKQLAKIPAHLFTVNSLALSPDGRYLVSASRDKTIKLWDADSLKLLKVVDHERHVGHTHSVNRIFWLEDDSVISSSDDRSMLRWRFSINN
jgi:WD40 repeat protein